MTNDPNNLYHKQMLAQVLSKKGINVSPDRLVFIGWQMLAEPGSNDSTTYTPERSATVWYFPEATFYQGADSVRCQAILNSTTVVDNGTGDPSGFTVKNLICDKLETSIAGSAGFYGCTQMKGKKCLKFLQET